jgi:hypothetical protein
MTGSGTWSAGGCGCRRVALINFRVSLRRSCGHRFRIAGRAHFTERSCRRPDPPSGSWAWGWALRGRRAGCARFRFRFPGENFFGLFRAARAAFLPPPRAGSGPGRRKRATKSPQTSTNSGTILHYPRAALPRASRSVHWEHAPGEPGELSEHCSRPLRPTCTWAGAASLPATLHNPA